MKTKEEGPNWGKILRGELDGYLPKVKAQQGPGAEMQKNVQSLIARLKAGKG